MEEDSGKNKIWILICFIVLLGLAIYYAKVLAPSKDPDQVAISQVDTCTDGTCSESEPDISIPKDSSVPHCTNSHCQTNIDGQDYWPNCSVWKYTCSGATSLKCQDNPQGPAKSAAFDTRNCNITQRIIYTCNTNAQPLDEIVKVFPTCETKLSQPNQPTINQVASNPTPTPSPSANVTTQITSPTTALPSTTTALATTQTVITPTPSPSPSIAPVAACKNVLTYDKSWQLLSLSDFSKYKAGDQFYLCASGTGNVGIFTKAAFTINSTTRPEVSFKKPDNTNYFCDLYTIPDNIYELNVSAKIYNTELGWK